MRDLLLVGAGGFAGSVARYLVGGWVTQLAAGARMPFGTLAVNALGCLVIGVVGALAEQRDLFGAPLRLLLFTGVLGGFTTFSAFGYETFFLVREQRWGLAALSIALHLVIALPCVWLGFRLGGLMAR